MADLRTEKWLFKEIVFSLRDPLIPLFSKLQTVSYSHSFEAVTGSNTTRKLDVP